MKSNGIISSILLIGIIGCVAYLYFDRFHGIPDISWEPDLHLFPRAPSEIGEVETLAEKSVPDRRVIIYYFYSEAKDRVCHDIETFVDDALDVFFPVELTMGELEWQQVDIEKSENEHFSEEYGISGCAIILVGMEKDKTSKWKNLSNLRHLTGDRGAFITYLVDETRVFIAENKSETSIH